MIIIPVFQSGRHSCKRDVNINCINATSHSTYSTITVPGIVVNKTDLQNGLKRGMKGTFVDGYIFAMVIISELVGSK
jgi:hypothetical protein